MSGRTENFFVLADVQFFQTGTGRTEIFARVEFARLVSENLADGSGHSQTAVGVDVDFANCALGSSAELIFADTDSIFEFTAVFVDDLDQILRNAGRTMENDGEAGDAFFDLSENVQTDFGIIAGLEFVSTMAGTDSDSQ